MNYWDGLGGVGYVFPVVTNLSLPLQDVLCRGPL